MLRLLVGRSRLLATPLLSSTRSAGPHTTKLSPLHPSWYRRAMASTVADLDWNRVDTPGPPAYDVFTKPVQKSERDDREYRVIRLQNGLHATLVHDPKADKAAASLDVGTGHLYDPDDMPGLAHFCEHLLFMGTENYPGENEYSEYLAKNNGSSNAYTGTSNTNYFFTVSTHALSGALSRFASFFSCPLFAPSCTARELNAVNSEHRKNYQSDIWRIFQLNKHLVKPGHPFGKFGSGNIESLSRAAKEAQAKGLLQDDSASGHATPASMFATPTSSRAATPLPPSVSSNSEPRGDGGVIGREIRRRLVEWWSKEYSANRMNLCVIGKESLDELSDLVSTLFSPIENRGVEASHMITDHPFGPDQSGTLVSAHTIMALHALEVSFPLAYQPPLWRHHPGSFACHFLGHEGPGSIHSYLKNKGWATALSAGSQPLGRGFAMLRITVHLTEAGFENYRDVITTVFKFISLLKAPLPAWHSKETSDIYALRFRFAEKRRPDDYAVWVSEHMSWPTPKDRLLTAPQLMEPWEETDPTNTGAKEFKEMIDTLTIDKARVVLMAKKEEYDRVRPGLQWEKEPIYGTPFHVERMDATLVAEAQKPNDIPELFLPQPNEFIPDSLAVDKREIATPAKRPILIRETKTSSLWHKKDDRFWLPRAQVFMDIRSPVASESVRAAVMTRLFTELVQHSLSEFSYAADLADLSYSFNAHELGIFMSLGGYNDKLHVLAKDVFEKARNLVVKPEELEIIKAQRVRETRNYFIGAPFRISDYYARLILCDKQWPLEDKLPIIPTVTVDEMQEFINRLFSECNVRMLVVGNVYKDEAVHLAETAEKYLRLSPPPEPVEQAGRIPAPGSNYVWQSDLPNPNEPNSALSYYIHTSGLRDPRTRVLEAFIAQYLHEPAFNTLRTKEQLGYIVDASHWSASAQGEGGIRIAIQSERYPAYLEERVEAFLDEIKEKLPAMSDEEFAEHKKGLEKRWTEQPKNLKEEAMRYWLEIDSAGYDFLRREENVKVLAEIQQKDVVEYFNTFIHQSSPTRAKYSIHMRSQRPRPKKVSEEAMLAFENAVAERAPGVPAANWREELFASGEPELKQASEYWTRILSNGSELSTETRDQLLGELPRLADANPSKAEYEGRLKDGVTVITDHKEYKASLRVSDPPRPVVEWNDLPIAKF